MTARYRKSGFTLVEILIVVVILGILAAIVIPQFSSASESAKASSLKSTLQTVRSQLELYQVQHNGKYPPAMTEDATTGPQWQHMTEAHNWEPDTTDPTAEGTYTFESDDPAATKLGPYMQKFPSNPFAGNATDPATHWEYDEATGEIKALVSMLDADDVELLGLDDADDYVQP